MIKSPSKMAGIIIFVLLFSSEYDIFVLNNKVLGVLTMDKIKANLIKAIQGKTNAYQRLSVNDIVNISQALKNLAEAEVYFQSIEKEKAKIEREKAEMKMQRMYGCSDDIAIGFCD